MNQISNYAFRYALRLALVSALISSALVIGLMRPMIVKERNQTEQYVSLYRESALDYALQEQALTDRIGDLQELIVEVYEKYQLVSAQIEAGFVGSSVEDMRLLLEEAEKMPFGTPFSNGHRVTAEYGVYTIDEFGWSGVNHPGIDIVPLNGDGTIYSPVDGVITNFGYSDLYGKWVEITTQAGYQLFFAHLSVIYWQTQLDNGNWTLKPGTPVKKGTRIAQMGMTGTFATGPHLHYEIRTRTEDGNWITMDPKAIVSWTGAIGDVE